MPRHRLVLILACILGLAVTAGLAWRAGVFKSQASAAVGGPFQLVNQDGVPTTEKALKGKWSAVFFGFTYCPDVCPGTLQGLSAATDQLGPKAKDLQIVFISIDPARDTPEQMRLYLSNFDPRIQGFTGTPETVAQAAKAYRAYYEKVGEGDGYTMNHSLTVYLMGPDGKFRTAVAYGLGPDKSTTIIEDAMARG